MGDSLKIGIVYDGGPNYAWDGTYAARGIGGSEECLIMLAQALARHGQDVTVYNRCSHNEPFTYRGVIYKDFSLWDKSEPFELLISWRNWYLLKDTNAKVRFHSTHDVPNGSHAPQRGENYGIIDKVVFTNNYHRELHPWIGDGQCLVCPIGIPQSTEPIEKIVRDHARVLFLSHPNRGLHVLRDVWPKVKAAVPEATLAAFWWEPEHFKEANEDLGILPMRALGYFEVEHECLRAGVFGYPCTFREETFSATTVKAQAGGCYPCVVVQGGMRDTCVYGVRTTHAEFGDKLIETLKRSLAGELELERKAMSIWAKSYHNWDTVALKYIETASTYI